MNDKKFTYINEYYEKQFKAGLKAKELVSGEIGILKYGTNYVFIEIYGQLRNYHPKDIELLEKKKC